MGNHEGASIDGFLNVFKPSGWTSHDVVQLIRRLTGVRRVGHGGTLDPAATGVLLVAVGRATRLIDYLVSMDKLYEADVRLGVATDTDDAEGEILCSRDPSHLTLDDVTGALGSFLGRLEQVPPQFSAVKLSGRKAYELARKGERAEMAPRTVLIKGMAVTGWEPPLLSLLILCSKGTYIRSIARDLGERLGVGGHLTRLVRQSVGPFTAARALTIDQLRAAAASGEIDRQLLPPDWAVSHLPSLVVSEEKARDMAIGRPWEVEPSFHGEGRARVYTHRGRFLGLVDRDGEMWQPRLVLAEEPVTDRERTAT